MRPRDERDVEGRADEVEEGGDQRQRQLGEVLAAASDVHAGREALTHQRVGGGGAGLAERNALLALRLYALYDESSPRYALVVSFSSFFSSADS